MATIDEPFCAVEATTLPRLEIRLFLTLDVVYFIIIIIIILILGTVGS